MLAASAVCEAVVTWRSWQLGIVGTVAPDAPESGDQVTNDAGDHRSYEQSEQPG
jgi:hypothetical protein